MTEKDTFRDFIEEIITHSNEYKNLEREEALFRLVEWYADWLGKVLRNGKEFFIEIWDENDGWGSIITSEQLKKDVEDMINLIPNDKPDKRYFRTNYVNKIWSVEVSEKDDETR